MRCIHAEFNFKHDVYVALCKEKNENCIDDIYRKELIPSNIIDFSYLSDNSYICEKCGISFTGEEFSRYYLEFLNIVSEWYKVETPKMKPYSRKRIEENLRRDGLLGPEISLDGKNIRCIHAIYNKETNDYNYLLTIDNIDGELNVVCKLCGMKLYEFINSACIPDYYHDELPYKPTTNYKLIHSPLSPKEIEEKIKFTGLLGPEINK